MKNTILILAVALFFFGCSLPKKANVAKDPDPDLKPIKEKIAVTVGPIDMLVKFYIEIDKVDAKKTVQYAVHFNVSRVESHLVWKYAFISYLAINKKTSKGRMFNGSMHNPLFTLTIKTDLHRKVEYIEAPNFEDGEAKSIMEEIIKEISRWTPLPASFAQNQIYVDVFKYRVAGVTKFLGRDVVKLQIVEEKEDIKFSETIGYQLIDVKTGHVLYSEENDSNERGTIKTEVGAIILP
jgi:hypothetical protein